MFRWCLFFLFVGLAAAATIREKRASPGGYQEDYEYNVATNCREYPAFGITDPLQCSLAKQQDNVLYNPMAGPTWNIDSSGQNRGCKTGWVGFRDHCYLIGTGVVALAGSTWDDADTLCKNAGGYLANINDDSEHAWIKSKITAALVPAPFTQAAIGGKKGADGVWRWELDQSPVPTTSTSWDAATSQPVPANGAVMVISEDGWQTLDTAGAGATPNGYVCEMTITSNLPGYCRWDAYRANTDIKSACMCPTTMETCQRRPTCHWYEDPNSPFKECISNSERFYNMLHRLLIRRGKKDFAIKIRYGATPARGKLPLGPYGPSVIGQGSQRPASMYGRYNGRGMYGMQGMYGRGQQGMYGRGMSSYMNPYGQPSYGGYGGGHMGHFGGGFGGQQNYGGYGGGWQGYGRRG